MKTYLTFFLRYGKKVNSMIEGGRDDQFRFEHL